MRFRIIAPTSLAATFALVADFSRLAEWDPLVEDSRLYSGNHLEEGSEYQIRGRFLGRPYQLRYRLAEINPPHRVAYQGGTARVQSTDTIEVAAVAGGTEVTFESRIRLGGWARLLVPLLFPALFWSGRTRSLPGLRRRLEELAAN